jgi:hypothetical protein
MLNFEVREEKAETAEHRVPADQVVQGEKAVVVEDHAAVVMEESPVLPVYRVIRALLARTENLESELHDEVPLHTVCHL